MLFRCFFICSAFYLHSLFSAWTDEEIHAELAAARAEIEIVRAEIGVLPPDKTGKILAFPLSLSMAEWASRKAVSTSIESDQLKYSALARKILNDETDIEWSDRALTSKEAACMASISISIALASSDDENVLWNKGPDAKGRAKPPHYDYLKKSALTGRYIAAKTSSLTQEGVVTWARMPGIRNFLIAPLENVKPENIIEFFTPNEVLVNIAGEAVTDWKTAGHPDTWVITEDAKERLIIVDGIIHAHDSSWQPDRNRLPTLADVRGAYNELRRLGDAVSGDLQFPCDSMSDSVERGYSPLKITKIIPLFSLLNPKNFRDLLPQEGFSDTGFFIGNTLVESPISQWRYKALLPGFLDDFAVTSAVLDQMDPIIKSGGFGGQGVHRLDSFQIANTKKLLELGRKYFAGHYAESRTKADLFAAIDARLTALGTELTAHYDGRILTKAEIMTHLGYVMNGYPTGFTTPLASHSGSDKVTEADWIEILSMIFDFSQNLDTFCLNAGIDMTPYNLESNFYSQLWENQFTGGGCVPGRKNRVVYRFANLLRQWMTFGYRLA